MKQISVRITPSANMVKRIVRPGQVVVCKSGAWPGYRISWEAPQAGEDVTLVSEQLVNGEAYVFPNGTFREFWITTESGLPHASAFKEDIELRIIDQALPVVTLNPRKFDGFRETVVWESVTALLAHPGTLTVYSTPAQAAAGDLASQGRGAVIPRGWIAGGISMATAGILRMYAALDIAQSYYCEIAKWHIDTADGNGRFSASFELGGRNAFNAAGTNSYNGPGLISWPARGLQLKLTTIAANITDAQITLLSRTGDV